MLIRQSRLNSAQDSVSPTELQRLTARDSVSQKELRTAASHKRNCELQRLTKGELQRLTKGTANCSVSQKELRTAASQKVQSLGVTTAFIMKLLIDRPGQRLTIELSRLTARDSVSPTELQRLTARDSVSQKELPTAASHKTRTAASHKRNCEL